MIKYCYIHIPFCSKICSYCDFCKMLNYDKFIDTYLDALEEEIKTIYKGDTLDTIYIGGGTPSCLNIKQLKRLFEILNIFKRSNNFEFTIEGNFESTDLDKLKLYKEYGINRLSFGIETINNKYLEYLNRSLDLNEVEKVLENCRELGFNNINVDLMYAIDEESIKDLEIDLDYVLSLNVEHISTYSLIIEDHTILGINKTDNIDPDLDDDMYKCICNKLKDNGYIHYEISNFCKEGYESRHNNSYWANENYYGFGLGASSYIENRRTTNTRSLNHYKLKRYPKEIEYLDINSMMEYEVILNLRRNTGIDLKLFKEKYDKELSEVYNYKRLIGLGLLKEENNHLIIPEDKWYISNYILTCILGE